MQIKPEKKVCLLVVIQTQGLLPSESMFFVSLYSGQGLFTRETKHDKTKKPRSHQANVTLPVNTEHCLYLGMM